MIFEIMFDFFKCKEKKNYIIIYCAYKLIGIGKNS